MCHARACVILCYALNANFHPFHRKEVTYKQEHNACKTYTLHNTLHVHVQTSTHTYIRSHVCAKENFL